MTDDKAVVAAAPLSRADVALPAEGFVFCCFNNSYRIRPQMFDVWMRLLRRVQGSVFFLTIAPKPSTICATRPASVAWPERLISAARVGSEEHLVRHRQAGLFLDTLPYNAHTTASDALRSGVPLVTSVGNNFASRVAASLLHAVGLSELVTQSLQDYEALAIKLTEDPDHLRRVRATLAANLATPALFDTDRFRCNIEAAYLEMHRRQQAGEPAEGFAVPLP